MAMRGQMLRGILLCLLFVCSFNTASSQTWSSIRPGLQWFEGTFFDQSTPVSFVLFRVNPKLNVVRVIDTKQELSAENSFSEFSLREIRQKTKATIVVNAGSTKTFSFPDPLGLLKVKGKLVSRTNAQTPHGGVLCLSGRAVSILPASSNPESKCTEAVQRGPLLPPTFRAFTSDWNVRSQRTMFAVDSEGQLLILTTRTSSSLAGAASFLYNQRPDLHIQTILNMDGSGSSGLLFGMSTADTLTVGNVSSLVASALAIY